MRLWKPGNMTPGGRRGRPRDHGHIRIKREETGYGTKARIRETPATRVWDGRHPGGRERGLDGHSAVAGLCRSRGNAGVHRAVCRSPTVDCVCLLRFVALPPDRACGLDIAAHVQCAE